MRAQTRSLHLQGTKEAEQRPESYIELATDVPQGFFWS